VRFPRQTIIRIQLNRESRCSVFELAALQKPSARDEFQPAGQQKNLSPSAVCFPSPVWRGRNNCSNRRRTLFSLSERNLHNCPSALIRPQTCSTAKIDSAAHFLRHVAGTNYFKNTATDVIPDKATKKEQFLLYNLSRVKTKAKRTIATPTQK